MARLPVAEDVQEHGPLSGLEQRALAADRVGDRERVAPVDDLGVEAHLVEAAGEPGEAVVAHRLTRGLPAHRVEVVDEEEDDGETAAVPLVPEPAELLHPGEVDRLPDHAAAARAVADARNRDPLPPRVQALVERRAGRDRRGSADDRVVRVDAEGREERVHAPGETAVEAGLAAQDLREQPVEQEADAALVGADRVEAAVHELEGRAVAPARHDRLERVVVELLDRREPLRDHVAVAAVAAEDVIAGLEGGGQAHGGCFLADREMSRPRVVVADVAVSPGPLEAVEHLLELADDHHVAQHPLQRVVAERPARVLERDGVGVDGNGPRPKLAAPAGRARVDDQALRQRGPPRGAGATTPTCTSGAVTSGRRRAAR